MEKALQRQRDKREKEKTRRELLGEIVFRFFQTGFCRVCIRRIVAVISRKAEGEVSVLGIFTVVTLGISGTIVFVSIGNKVLK